VAEPANTSRHERASKTGGTALSVRDLSKTFDGQRALHGVSLDVPEGSVTALLGHNGSGKSTLIKILAGVVSPDESGDRLVRVHGNEFSLPTTEAAARSAGLHFVHQDLGLIEQMSVAENMGLYDGFVVRRHLRTLDEKGTRARAQEALARVGVRIPSRRLIQELAPAERSLVAIARMLYRVRPEGRPIMILDEPTASLAEAEAEHLFQLIRDAVSQGAACVYVSHRLGEIHALADYVTVLRDGQTVLSSAIADCPRDTLVEAIVGSAETRSSESGGLGVVVSSPANLAVTGPSEPQPPDRPSVMRFRDVLGRRLRGVSFDVRAGDIVGVTGLLGCGKSEFVRIAAGASRPASGVVELDGRPFVPHDRRDAARMGVGYVPQDRRRHGLLAPLTTGENLTLPVLGTLTRAGLISRTRENRQARSLIAMVGITPPSTTMISGHLSGGNQQKVVVARNLRVGLRLLAIDELSQGVDVRTRADLRDLLRGLAETGVGVVLASSDDAELCEIATRILILSEGAIVAELDPRGLDEDALAAEVLIASASDLSSQRHNQPPRDDGRSPAEAS
jgi:ribose transport system ATP-binding protein